ncbi:A-kinase anchor protein 13 [Saguinus oedipus]|uniref:A-kinase anchor protein 13 n=1 Tax=Saguinus oedipus TaxID=9490 RepID=A0ABQ9TD65_SAGOE|nr:A-kinase anchor protein 13 [Saguinus oedipus]
MVTAQDPSGAPQTDGQFLPCAPEPMDSQQLSSPEETKSTQCCPGSSVAQTESPCDLSSIVEEENTDRSYRKKNKGVERKEEEVGPAPIVDSGTVSNQGSCLQSLPDYGVKGMKGRSSCGNKNEETETKSSGMPTDQESLSSGDAVLQRDVVMVPGTAQYSSAGELAGVSATDVGTPESTGEAEHGLMNPDATVQKNVLQVGESTKEGLENSNMGTAGASDVQVTSKPVDKVSVPNCASATSSLGGNKPAESSLAFSNEETSIEKTAETETSRSCEESADAPVDQNSVVPAAAKDKISDELEPCTVLAGIGEATSPSDLALPGLEVDVMPHQNSERNSSHAQSQKGKSSPICSTTGDYKLCSNSAYQQNTVTSSGELVAQLCDNKVSQPKSTTARQPNSQDPPKATHCEDPQASTVTSDPLSDTQERVDFCPFKVVDNKGQGKVVKLDKSLANILEVPSYPHPVVPKMEKELVPDQAVISDSTFFLANSPGSESVTRDDALSFVPSQKEKGTATPALHAATDCRDGPDGDSNDPNTRPLEGRAAGLSTCSTAAELQLGMGNTSLTGLGGEHEGSAPSAAPEVLSIKGDTDSSLQNGGKATLALDSVLTEEGEILVVSESSGAQEQDKDKAVTCSSIKENALSSETLQEEQGTPPPEQETPQFHEKSISAASAKDEALQLSNSPGAPSACLKAETERIKEVAPQVSLLTQGGAFQSLVLPGASLGTNSRQEALGAEQNSSTLLRYLLPVGSDRSEALNCSQPSPLDDGVKDTQSQGKPNASSCEVSGNVTMDFTGFNDLQDTAEPRKRSVSHNTQDILIPNVLSSQEKKVILGLPVALQDKAVTDPQGFGTPEMVLLDSEKGKLEGADHRCNTGDSEKARIDNEAHPVLLQPAAKELPTEMGLSAHRDGAPAGQREVIRGPPSGRERSTPSLPCLVSAQAAPLPKGVDLIEEAASRIVDAVIQRVKAARALLTEEKACHESVSSAELDPVTEGLVNASTEKVSAFPPGESLPVGSTHEEVTGSLGGCFAGGEEPEKIILPVQGPEAATESVWCPGKNTGIFVVLMSYSHWVGSHINSHHHQERRLISGLDRFCFLFLFSSTIENSAGKLCLIYKSETPFLPYYPSLYSEQI